MSQPLALPGEMEKEDLFKLAQSTSGAVPCCLPRCAFCLATLSPSSPAWLATACCGAFPPLPPSGCVRKLA